MRFYFNKKSSELATVTDNGMLRKVIPGNQKVFIYFYGDIQTLPNGTLCFEHAVAAVFKIKTAHARTSKISFIKLI